MIKITERYIKIDSVGNSLILAKSIDETTSANNEFLQLLYYGKKLNDHDDYGIFGEGRADHYNGTSNDEYPIVPTVFTSSGDNSGREQYARISYDGIFTNHFVFAGAERVDGFDSPLPTARNKGETVKLSFVDKVSGATVNQYYTVFSDSDVIAVHSEVVNTADKEIFVLGLASLQLDFSADRAEVVTFDGRWGAERCRHETEVVAGKLSIESRNGVSSPMHNPFFMAKVGSKTMGFNLIYSGNHRETVEVTAYKRVRIVTGMNDYALSYRLDKGEKLVSPEAIFVCKDTEAEITAQMHGFALNHIVSPVFAYKERPVLINNWEGTYFTFTGEKILDIAKKAAACGIEMMVLDDGWFGKRDDDKTGLGDWFDNEKKTGGLKKLADGVKALGMKFGLWVEPEMISKNSDLYRAHPEYAQAIPGVEPTERRWQLCLDMANPKVCDYIAETLIRLFKEVGVDYVKWDNNRSMCDVYSSTLSNQSEYFYRYYVGQYSVLRRITEACPEVLFESCASGGSRYDLGMMYFMAQNWASDNTYAFDRLSIQEGTLAGYPQSSMGAHVNAHGYSLETRFNVAAIGAFGYEFDITKSTDEELEVIKNQVAFYKQHRKLLQYGNYLRIGESVTKSDIGGWMVISDDKSEAIAVLIEKERTHMLYHPRFTFTGLDENALYKVTARKQANVEKTLEFTAYGDALCSDGLYLGNFYHTEKDKKQYPNTFSSRMFYFKKLN